MNGPWVEYQTTGSEARRPGDRTPPPGYRYDPERDSFVRDLALVEQVAPEGAGPWADYGASTPDEAARAQSYRAAQPTWLEDQMRSADVGLERMATSLLGTPQFIAEFFGNGPERPYLPYDQAERDMWSGLGDLLPSQQEIYDWAHPDRPEYQPQSEAGEYTRSIFEQAPGALTGRGWTRLLDPLLAGAGSEAAGDMAAQYGPQAEAVARFAGGFGGSMASNMAPNGRELSMLGNSIRGVPRADMERAQQLMENARRRGIPLTIAEAIDYASGSSRATHLQRLLEPTPEGVARIGPMMAERPAGVRQATLDSLATWAPDPPPPSDIARRAQAGAEGALTTARRRVNESAAPLYGSLPGQTIDPADMARLQQEPAFMQAMSEVLSDPITGARFAGVSTDDMSLLNAVVQRMRTNADNLTGVEAGVARDRPKASLIGQQADLAQEIGQATSPDYARALETVSSGHRAFVDPLKAGPLGVMAGERPHPNLGAQESALFPSAAPEGQVNDTMTALRMLEMQDPALPRDILRQHLGSEFGEAAQDLATGPNQWGGAAFRARVMGNPNQRETLEAALRSVGGDDTLDLMSVLEATGTRQRPGSPTAFFGQGLEEMKGANTLTRTLQGGWSPWRSVGDALEEANARRNASALSEALMADPKDALAVMERAQSVVDDNKLLRALLAGTWSQ